MSIIKRMTMDRAIDDIVDLFRTMTTDSPKGTMDKIRIREAIYHIASFVTGVNPYIDYPLDDIIEILKTHRADVVEALAERGLRFHVSALNNGMILAEVTHSKTGQSVHCPITVEYNPALLAARFYETGGSVAGTIH